MSIITRVFHVTRLGDTSYGHPRYEIATADGIFVTQADTAFSYLLTDDLKYLPDRFELDITAKGWVRNWTRIPEDKPTPTPLFTKEERRHIAAYLHGHDWGVVKIADLLRVSVTTVIRDLKGE